MRTRMSERFPRFKALRPDLRCEANSDMGVRLQIPLSVTKKRSLGVRLDGYHRRYALVFGKLNQPRYEIPFGLL